MSLGEPSEPGQALKQCQNQAPKGNFQTIPTMSSPAAPGTPKTRLKMAVMGNYKSKGQSSGSNVEMSLE